MGIITFYWNTVLGFPLRFVNEELLEKLPDWGVPCYKVCATLVLLLVLSDIFGRSKKVVRKLLGKDRLVDLTEYEPYTVKNRKFVEELDAADHLEATIKPLIARKQYDRVAEVFASLNRWKEAGKWFAKAGDRKRAAEHLAKAGQTVKAAKLLLKAGEYTTAARFFAETGKHAAAARAYEKAGDMARAGDCFSKADKKLRAAECYEKVRDFYRAGVAYAQIRRHQAALRVLKQIPKEDANFERSRLLITRCQAALKNSQLRE